MTLRARWSAFAVAFILIAGFSAAGSAHDFEVKMLNKGDGQLFHYAPNILHVAPGDTVTFVSATPGHDVQSIRGMIPEGAKPIRVNFNRTETVTFEVPGIYGFKCTPHAAFGMVGVIVVGDPANGDTAHEAARALPAKARATMLKILDEIV